MSIPTRLDERGIRHYDVPLPRDLVEMLANTVATHPEKTAYVTDAGSLTWREFGDEVKALAGRLAGRGVRPGDRVAVLAGNGLPYTVAVNAVWRAGGVVVPLNFRLTAGDLAGLLGDSGARLLLVGAGHARTRSRCGQEPGRNDRRTTSRGRRTLPHGPPDRRGPPHDAGQRCPCRDHVHLRHDWPSEGRGDQPRQRLAEQRHMHRRHRASPGGCGTGDGAAVQHHRAGITDGPGDAPGHDRGALGRVRRRAGAGCNRPSPRHVHSRCTDDVVAPTGGRGVSGAHRARRAQARPLRWSADAHRSDPTDAAGDATGNLWQRLRHDRDLLHDHVRGRRRSRLPCPHRRAPLAADRAASGVTARRPGGRRWRSR